MEALVPPCSASCALKSYQAYESFDQIKQIAAASLGITNSTESSATFSLSIYLKTGTQAVHKEVENHLFIKKLMKGELKQSEYAQYLSDLHLVYSTLETLIEEHNVLARAFSQRFFLKDLSALGKNSENLSPSSAAQDYATHLMSLVFSFWSRICTLAI